MDNTVRKPHENPAIGIVLCKNANKKFVEYVIQDYQKPMGVATYTTAGDMPEELRKALPDMEELKRILSQENSWYVRRVTPIQIIQTSLENWKSETRLANWKLLPA